MVALGVKVFFAGKSTCINNKALQGGGGCLLWDTLAKYAHDSKWIDNAPVFKSEEDWFGEEAIIHSNEASYSKKIGTTAYSVDVIAPYFPQHDPNGQPGEAMRTKMSSTTSGGLLTPAPFVVLRDFYGEIVQGRGVDSYDVDGYVIDIKAKYIKAEYFCMKDGEAWHECYDNPTTQTEAKFVCMLNGEERGNAECDENPTMKTKLSGFTTGYADSNGHVNFTELVLSGVPGSGPHTIQYETTFDLRVEDVGGKRRELWSEATSSAYVDPCSSTTFLDAATCRECPLNSYLKKRSGHVDKACLCKKNYYSNIPSPNVLGCLECPKMSFSPEGSTKIEQCLCPSDRVRTNNICVLCAAGETKDAKTGQCRPCLAGMFKKNIGIQPCDACPVDTYNSREGATAASECIACAVEKTTGDKTGCASSVDCLCKKGAFFKKTTAATTTTAEKNETTCEVCPPGADCSKHHDVDIRAVGGLPGHWHSSEDGTTFSNCRKAYFGVNAEKWATDRCCPIDPLTNQSICMDLNLTDHNLDAQVRQFLLVIPVETFIIFLVFLSCSSHTLDSFFHFVIINLHSARRDILDQCVKFVQRTTSCRLESAKSARVVPTIPQLLSSC